MVQSCHISKNHQELLVPEFPQFLVSLGNRSSRWLGESAVLGDFRNPEFRVTAGTQSQSHPEHRVPGVKRYSWFLSHKELRVSGATRKSGFPGLRFPVVTRNTWVPKSPATPGFQVPEVLGDSGTLITGWLWEPGVTGDSGNPEFRVTPGIQYQSHQEHRVPGIARTYWFPQSPGNPCSRSHPELRVIGTPRSRNHQELRVNGVALNPRIARLRVPGITLNPGFPWPHFLGVPRYSESTEFRVTPVTQFQSHEELWLAESPGTPGSRIQPELRVPGVPGDSRNPEVLVTWNRSSEWLHKTEVPVNPEDGFPGD